MKRFLAIVLSAGFAAELPAAEPAKMLELKLQGSEYVGKIAAKTDEHVWLLQRDGRLDRLAIAEVVDYRPLTDSFRPYASADLRDRLVREFGRGYEVAGSLHYLVVAQRGRAKQIVTQFEELFRELQVYLAAHDFRIKEPEFPLVAVVFASQNEFAEYCQQEGVRAQSGLLGYYLITSNRVALYETGTSGQLDDTVIHEAFHQVAFNLGLHRRIGENPLWLVEGLATVFEPENFRHPLPATPTKAKINRERYLRFQNYAAQRRPAKSLEDFVRADDLFQTGTLDAYAQAWSLTFFLLETRQAQFSDYLRRIAARSASETYGPDERIEDFQKSFGQDLTLLEADFLRFTAGLGR